ncbi:hypothetical protein Sjap_005698 [Stephania japonica]|uniref:Uncharacterized protein n=1 Tax=Stephania japonica TaxID=461633 RepID=A0AAP0PLD7_9MAGN
MGYGPTSGRDQVILPFSWNHVKAHKLSKKTWIEQKVKCRFRINYVNKSSTNYLPNVTRNSQPYSIFSFSKVEVRLIGRRL